MKLLSTYLTKAEALKRYGCICGSCRLVETGAAELVTGLVLWALIIGGILLLAL